MKVLCGFCGADVTERPCACRRPVSPRSTLLDVCLTATVTRGRVDEHSLREAAAVLRERPS